MATGRLTRNNTASSTELIICSGPGIKPQNIPTATPPETERRCKCHRLWCFNHTPKGCAQRCCWMNSWLGRKFLKYFFGTMHLFPEKSELMDYPIVWHLPATHAINWIGTEYQNSAHPMRHHIGMTFDPEAASAESTQGVSGANKSRGRLWHLGSS